MLLSQIELQNAGENGRSSGYAFEDIIKEEINNRTISGESIIKYILEKENIQYKNAVVEAVKTPKNVEDILGGRKVPPKADIFLVVNDQKIGISIKSSPANIQVQITNVDRFRKICKFNGLIFSDELYIALCKFCGWETYKPSPIEALELEQGRRERWLYHELTNNEQLEIKKFFTINEKKVISIVLKEGSSDPMYFADYYIVNKVAYSQSPIIDICIKSMEDVINQSATGFIPTKNGSFHVGRITVQMKGSGKGKAYHGLQFNKRGC